MNSSIRLLLNDEVVIAMAKMVDDAQSETREPSHSDIEFQIKRVGLLCADPKVQGQSVGKAKRIRAVLYWALEHNVEAGEVLVSQLLAMIRGIGGFRPNSLNYVGKEAIMNLIEISRRQGYDLSLEGELASRVLDNLSDVEVTEALRAYIKRAKRGSQDAALLAGTSKDLLEAVAAHALVVKWGSYPTTANFPTLLGQAFTALGLATANDKVTSGEPIHRRMERALYELGCAVNALRNKEGTGHGRPFLPSITNGQARSAIESMGIISEFLLDKLK
jgi:hypothetical protein